MEKSRSLPRRFESKEQWERFKEKIRRELPDVIGIPRFPAIKESQPRGRIRVGEDLVCERVDVYVNTDKGIPAFVVSPADPSIDPTPALVWNPGWSQDK